MSRWVCLGSVVRPGAPLGSLASFGFVCFIPERGRDRWDRLVSSGCLTALRGSLGSFGFLQFVWMRSGFHGFVRVRPRCHCVQSGSSGWFGWPRWSLVFSRSFGSYECALVVDGLVWVRLFRLCAP